MRPLIQRMNEEIEPYNWDYMNEGMWTPRKRPKRRKLSNKVRNKLLNSALSRLEQDFDYERRVVENFERQSSQRDTAVKERKL